MRHKIFLYTICYNEMAILPFMVDYWKLYYAKVFVYDNGSTDGSVEYLKQFDWIEVRPFHIGEKFDDVNNRDMKNKEWKESRGKCDYVVVCDMDEILFTKDLDKVLDYMDAKHITHCKCQGYQMVSETFPEYEEGKLLHEICYHGSFDSRYCKTLLFNPNLLDDINYNPGAHWCLPKGKCVREYDKKDVVMMHFKYLGYEYTVDKYAFLKNRLSDRNINLRWGTQYLWNNNKITGTMKKLLKNSKDFRTFFK